MSDLYRDISYLKASLRECVLDLNERSTPKSVFEIVRDARFAEVLLLPLDRVEALEKRCPTQS